VIAHIVNGFADRVEDRTHALECVAPPAGEHPEPAGAGFIAAAEDRGIQEIDAFLSVGFGFPQAGARVHGGVVEHDLPAADR